MTHGITGPGMESYAQPPVLDPVNDAFNAAAWAVSLVEDAAEKAGGSVGANLENSARKIRKGADLIRDLARRNGILLAADLANLAAGIAVDHGLDYKPVKRTFTSDLMYNVYVEYRAELEAAYKESGDLNAAANNFYGLVCGRVQRVMGIPLSEVPA